MYDKSIHPKHRQFNLKLSSNMGKVFHWEKKEAQWVKHTVNLFQAFVLYEYPVLWTVQLTIWYSIFNNLLLYIVKIYLLVLHHFNILRNCNGNSVKCELKWSVDMIAYGAGWLSLGKTQESVLQVQMSDALYPLSLSNTSM